VDDLLTVTGGPLDDSACRALAALPASADPALFAAASALRDRGKGRVVTYSPKVFLPVTNLCRDRCAYCTFRKDPDDPGAWTMTREEVRETVGRGRALGCTEALLCLGDRPEKAFRSYRTTLAALGHASTVGYVREVCEIVLAEGLLPHTNMGVLTAEEMTYLRPVNASLGLMLENVSPRLRAKGMPHHYAPDKEPAVRLRMLEEAGGLAIPFTTGILVGIGETRLERVDSLLAIRELHARHGHIQEVIVQNFRAKPDIPMADAPEPEDLEFARTVAMARLILGPEMNIQAPPNLSPRAHRRLLDAGINDWGGISPLTPDYVNPEAPWPHLAALERACADAGYKLAPRLCVYPEHVTPTWIDPALYGTVAAMATRLGDADGAPGSGAGRPRRDAPASRGRDTHAPAL
jgi:FO synthase